MNTFNKLHFAYSMDPTIPVWVTHRGALAGEMGVTLSFPAGVSTAPLPDLFQHTALFQRSDVYYYWLLNTRYRLPWVLTQSLAAVITKTSPDAWLCLLGQILAPTSWLLNIRYRLPFGFNAVGLAAEWSRKFKLHTEDTFVWSIVTPGYDKGNIKIRRKKHGANSSSQDAVGEESLSKFSPSLRKRDTDLENHTRAPTDTLHSLLMKMKSYVVQETTHVRQSISTEARVEALLLASPRSSTWKMFSAWITREERHCFSSLPNVLTATEGGEERTW